MQTRNTANFYTNRIDRLCDISLNLNLDFCIISSAPALTYYSGYFFYFEHGQSPFQVLPALLIISPKQGHTLLLADNEQPPEVTASILRVDTYQSYSFREPLSFPDQFDASVKSIIGKGSISKIRVGIESRSLPVFAADVIESSFPNVQWVDIFRDLAMERIVKDQLEISMIKSAAELCDLGQRTLKNNVKSGHTELELFSLVGRSINEAAGTRVPVMADFVSGPRTAQGGGIPSGKKILDNELLLADLTPCLNGYWGDCCGTIAAGNIISQQRNDFAKVKDGLFRAIDAIKPGVRSFQIDELLRKHVYDYPHHSGHGVGTMNHEEPRITPYNNMELQAGMVIALEPAIYRDDYGIRLEHLLLVTKDGAEQLTAFDYQL
ncbi:MAG: aminopeptidase P family protein [Chitinophagaceae bacterium]|nr:aminopeptidase P family protein [Chitinophagaceae bacterium]